MRASRRSSLGFSSVMKSSVCVAIILYLSNSGIPQCYSVIIIIFLSTACLLLQNWFPVELTSSQTAMTMFFQWKCGCPVQGTLGNHEVSNICEPSPWLTQMFCLLLLRPEHFPAENWMEQFQYLSGPDSFVSTCHTLWMTKLYILCWKPLIWWLRMAGSCYRRSVEPAEWSLPRIPCFYSEVVQHACMAWWAGIIKSDYLWFGC